MKELKELFIHYCESEYIHEDFRLWFSSNPTSNFLLSILQNWIIIIRSPAGLCSKLTNVYDVLTIEHFSQYRQKVKYKKLLSTLSWFRSVLIEWKRIKSLRLNKLYKFNEFGFLIFHYLLIVILDQYSDQNTLNVLRYFIDKLSYDNRVIDNMDQRLVKCYINDYFGEILIRQEFVFISYLPSWTKINFFIIATFLIYSKRRISWLL